MGITRETILLLFLLVPGFISSSIFRCIVKTGKRDALSHLFEVLSFSLVIYTIVSATVGWTPIVKMNGANDEVNMVFLCEYVTLILICVVVIFLPLLLAAIIENDLHMKTFRWLKITTQTSRSSTWHDAFASGNRFVSVMLKDGRTVVGSVMYYTGSSSQKKYIYIYKHAWVDDNGEYIESNAHGMLIKEESIEILQFLLEKNEQKECK